MHAHAPWDRSQRACEVSGCQHAVHQTCMYGLLARPVHSESSSFEDWPEHSDTCRFPAQEFSPSRACSRSISSRAKLAPDGHRSGSMHACWKRPHADPCAQRTVELRSGPIYAQSQSKSPARDLSPPRSPRKHEARSQRTVELADRASDPTHTLHSKPKLDFEEVASDRQLSPCERLQHRGDGSRHAIGESPGMVRGVERPGCIDPASKCLVTCLIIDRDSACPPPRAWPPRRAASVH